MDQGFLITDSQLRLGNHTLGVLSEIIVRAFQETLGVEPPTVESRLQYGNQIVPTRFYFAALLCLISRIVVDA